MVKNEGLVAFARCLPRGLARIHHGQPFTPLIGLRMAHASWITGTVEDRSGAEGGGKGGDWEAGQGWWTLTSSLPPLVS